MSGRRLVVRFVVSCLALLAAASLQVGAATLLRSADLEALVAESGSALLAEVRRVEYGYDERGLHSTWVTVRVEDPIFGDRLPGRGETYKFKTYGAPVAMPDGSRVFIDGTPVYRPGETFLLMLLPVSRFGFSGAAGLSQGVFRVHETPGGERSAESLVGNATVLGEKGLGRWLAGPVPYPLLRRAIVDLAAAADKGGP